MSINNLVIRGSTKISLHERFTSLRRGGGQSLAQQNDSLNESGYNRAGYVSVGGDTGYRDTSPGPAFRGPGGMPNYTTQDKYERDNSYRTGGAPPPPSYERYNPEQPYYHPPVRRAPPSPYDFHDDSGYEGNRPTYRPHSPGYTSAYSTYNQIPRRTPAVEAALRLKRRSLKQRLGIRPIDMNGTNWQRNNFAGGYLKNYGRFRYRGARGGRWTRGGWNRGRGGLRPRSRSMGRWGSTVSLASDGMIRRRRPRSNSFSGRRMGWTRGGRRGWGRGRAGWRAVDGKPPTKEQLDQQIDSYMASSKSGLDKELDSYMKEAAPIK